MEILVALDDSVFSEKVLRWAVQEARLHGARLTCVTIVEGLAQIEQLLPDMAGLARMALVSEAEKIAARNQGLARAEGVDMQALVIDAPTAAEGILDEARRIGADLIVLGSHGRKGIRRFVMGTVASRVMRHAPCTVAVVR